MERPISKLRSMIPKLHSHVDQAELIRQQEAEAKRQLEAEAKRQQEAEARRQLEAEARRQLEAEARRQLEAEARRQREAEARRQREAEARRQQEAETRKQQEAEARSQREVEARAYAAREAAEESRHRVAAAAAAAEERRALARVKGRAATRIQTILRSKQARTRRSVLHHRDEIYLLFEHEDSRRTMMFQSQREAAKFLQTAVNELRRIVSQPPRQHVNGGWHFVYASEDVSPLPENVRQYKNLLLDETLVELVQPLRSLPFMHTNSIADAAKAIVQRGESLADAEALLRRTIRQYPATTFLNRNGGLFLMRVALPEYIPEKTKLIFRNPSLQRTVVFESTMNASRFFHIPQWKLSQIVLGTAPKNVGRGWQLDDVGVAQDMDPDLRRYLSTMPDAVHLEFQQAFGENRRVFESVREAAEFFRGDSLDRAVKFIFKSCTNYPSDITFWDNYFLTDVSNPLVEVLPKKLVRPVWVDMVRRFQAAASVAATAAATNASVPATAAATNASVPAASNSSVTRVSKAASRPNKPATTAADEGSGSKRKRSDLIHIRGPVTSYVMMINGTRVILFGDEHSETVYRRQESKPQSGSVKVTDYLQRILGELPNGVLLLEEKYFGEGFGYDKEIFYNDPSKKALVSNYVDDVRRGFELCLRTEAGSFDSEQKYIRESGCTIDPSNRVFACDFRSRDGVCQFAAENGVPLPYLKDRVVRFLKRIQAKVLAGGRMANLKKEVFDEFLGGLLSGIAPSNPIYATIGYVEAMVNKVFMVRCRRVAEARELKAMFEFILDYIEHPTDPCNILRATNWRCDASAASASSSDEISGAFCLDLILHDLPVLVQYLITFQERQPAYVLTYFGWLHTSFHASFLQHMYGDGILRASVRSDRMRLPEETINLRFK